MNSLRSMGANLAKTITNHTFIERTIYSNELMFHAYSSNDEITKNLYSYAYFGTNISDINMFAIKKSFCYRQQYTNWSIKDYYLVLFINLGISKNYSYHAVVNVGMYGDRELFMNQRNIENYYCVGKEEKEYVINLSDDLKYHTNKIIDVTAEHNIRNSNVIYNTMSNQFNNLMKILLYNNIIFNKLRTYFTRMSLLNGAHTTGDYKKIFRTQEDLDVHLLSLYE